MSATLNRPGSIPPPGDRPLYGTASPSRPRPGGSGGSPSAPGSRGALVPLALIALAAVAAVLGLGLLGGSPEAPLSPVAQAAERTAALAGARFEGTGRASGAGVELSMSFSGAYDADADQTTMRIEMQSPGAPGAAAMMNPMVAVGDGSDLYMSAPVFRGALPGGKSWLKVDTSELGADMSAEALGTNGIDARSTLEQLGAAGDDARRVGRERVRGARTTRYAVTLQASAQAEALREAGAEQLAELVERQGGASTVEVWVDRKGFVRRTSMSTPFELAGGPGSTMSMTMDFFGFGVEPEIAVPTDAETFDATELGREALDEMLAS